MNMRELMVPLGLTHVHEKPDAELPSQKTTYGPPEHWKFMRQLFPLLEPSAGQVLMSTWGPVGMVGMLGGVVIVGGLDGDTDSLHCSKLATILPHLVSPRFTSASQVMRSALKKGVRHLRAWIPSR